MVKKESAAMDRFTSSKIELLKVYCKGKCINKNLPANVGLTTKQLMKSCVTHSHVKKVLNSHFNAVVTFVSLGNDNFGSNQSLVNNHISNWVSLPYRIFPGIPNSLFLVGLLKKY